MATRLVHAPKVTSDPYGAVSPPLYQTATFEQVSAVECGPYDYTRSGNPTRAQLEAHIAHLEARPCPLLLYCPPPCARILALSLFRPASPRGPSASEDG
jgi:cystathionine beta-lyase/cystathionine gamma-synthase